MFVINGHNMPGNNTVITVCIVCGFLSDISKLYLILSKFATQYGRMEFNIGYKPRSAYSGMEQHQSNLALKV